MFDGTWKHYQSGEGFPDERLFFSALAVAPKGYAWVAGTFEGVWRFDGEMWTRVEGHLRDSSCLAVDSKGVLWVGTNYGGVSRFDGNNWVTFDRRNGLSSNRVTCLTIDNRNRIWAGTECGLSVFDGQQWHAYYMHDSDILNNRNSSLEVAGSGPALPGKVQKESGRLTGRIMNGEVPLASVEVELCSETIASFYRGPTPCSDQPFSRITKSGEDGAFVFEDVPTGHYSISFKTGEGWMRLEGLGAGTSFVEPGGATSMEPIDFSKGR